MLLVEDPLPVRQKDIINPVLFGTVQLQVKFHEMEQEAMAVV